MEGRSRQGVEGHDRLDQVDPVDPGIRRDFGMSSKKLFFGWQAYSSIHRHAKMTKEAPGGVWQFKGTLWAPQDAS